MKLMRNLGGRRCRVCKLELDYYCSCCNRERLIYKKLLYMYLHDVQTCTYITTMVPDFGTVW